MKLVDLKCPNCGAELTFEASSRAAYCSYCGAKLALDDEVMHVHYDNAEEAGYAFERGRIRAQNEASRSTALSRPQEKVVYVYRDQPAGTPKNKWVALTLCFFLGIFGAHKFYEGKTGMGWLYLFTLGLFCIGWLVDLVTLIFKPNPYYVQ